MLKILRDNLKSEENSLEILVKEHIFLKLQDFNLQILRKVISITGIFQLICRHFRNISDL